MGRSTGFVFWFRLEAPSSSSALRSESSLVARPLSVDRAGLQETGRSPFISIHFIPRAEHGDVLREEKGREEKGRGRYLTRVGVCGLEVEVTRKRERESRRAPGKPNQTLGRKMTDDSKVDLACLGDDASKAKKVDVELAKTAAAPPSPSPASSPPSVVVKKEAKAKQTKQSPTAAAAGPKSKGKGKSTVAASLKRTKSAPPAVLQRKRSRSGPKSKSSSFIGVSQYRRTGRWEAHIWDCAKSRSTPGAKGRQLHLGSFDCAEDAARAYDRAAIHFRGINADTNYPREQYTHDPVLNALKELDKEEFVIKLRGVAQH